MLVASRFLADAEASGAIWRNRDLERKEHTVESCKMNPLIMASVMHLQETFLRFKLLFEASSGSITTICPSTKKKPPKTPAW